MYHTIESPLTLYLGFSAQGKSIKPLVSTDIGKNRLDRRHAVAIDHLAITTIDSPLHPVRCGSTIGVGDGDLPTMPFPRVGRVRIAHTLIFDRAMSAIRQLAFKE